MDTCGTCKYREYGGYCINPKLADGGDYPPDETPEMLIHEFGNGDGFWVGVDFGCVHHELKAP